MNLKEVLTHDNIEEAERIIAELKAAPKWDADAWFADLVKDLHSYPSPRFPGRRLHDGLIAGERVTLFEQDLKNGTVWCRWKYVWKVLEDEHSAQYTKVQAKVKDLLEEHLGWWVETTPAMCIYPVLKLEEHLGWWVETTEALRGGVHLQLEEHLGWWVETTGRREAWTGFSWKNTSNGG